MSECLLPQKGLYFICGDSAYQCLPANWTRFCTLGYVLPTISIADTTAPISIPLSTTPQISKRGGPLTPILIAISTLVRIAGVAGGNTGVVSANIIYVNLSFEFAQLNTQIASSLSTFQTQINSLAVDVLQNRWNLHILTAAQGGVWDILQEECFSLVNQISQIQDHIQYFLNKARQLQAQTK